MFYNIAWAKSEVQSQVESSNLLSDVLGAGIGVQLLLLVLIIMSFFSWTIIFQKLQQFKKLNELDSKFADFFWSSSNIQNINNRISEFKDSTLGNIFLAGYQELERLLKVTKEHGQNLSGYDIENIERALRKATDIELQKIESKLSFLATTGSTAPFIGLLGTVVGIMNSFRDIYKAGSASLATVAPGISEALFATAVGLFAAIPAVMAYNYLLQKLKRIENEMHNFNSDFLNISRRSFFNRGN